MHAAGSNLLKADQFGSVFNMKLEDGQTVKNSMVGSLMSILFFIVLGFYSLIKLEVLVYRKADKEVIST